jgi:hypothetical protein
MKILQWTSGEEPVLQLNIQFTELHMIKLDSGNVLLKPSHRKQLMAWLRRSLRIGQRLGDFMLTISLHRTGRSYVVQARVHDAVGDFDCRSRNHEWRTAARDIVRLLSLRLHQQQLRLAVA